MAATTELKVWAPRPYQPLMYDFMQAHPRCMLMVPMGFGKTSACLWSIAAGMLTGDVRRVLVLAPLRVARSTWPDEVRTWAQFSHIKCRMVTGNSKERMAALNDKTADVLTTNYENLPWLIEALKGEWPFDLVIADESTRLKSFRTRQGGSRARALAEVAFRSPRWVGLTGTAAPNGLQDLWGQMWFVDRGQRLYTTFGAFMSRWFRNKPGSDPKHQRFEPMPHSEEEIHAAIADVCFALDVKDWFDLREPIVHNVYIDLPPPAAASYKEMEREMFTRLGTHEVEAFGAAAKTLKCLQLASGAAYVGESNTEWMEVHDEKLDALQSIVEEAAGAPILVAYHFRSDLARLLRRFPNARRLDADPNTLVEWNNGEIEILLAHPASAGHGLNLARGGNILVFFSVWWALEERLQIIERLGAVRQYQAGIDRPTYIYYILARGTVDETVLSRTDSKQSVQDALLLSIKHKATP